MSKDKKIFDRREDSEEEKYQFMIEQIRPQRKRNLVQYLKKMCGVMILAVVFGAMAGLAFIAVQNVMWKDSSDTLQQTMASGAEAAVEDIKKTEAEQEAAFEDAIASLEDYQYFCEKAALIGERCNKYIVEIKEETEDEPFRDDGTAAPMKSGAVFRETTQYYYILTISDGISENENIKITFFEASETEAEVLGVDHSLGIAVLQVKKKTIPGKIRKEIEVGGFGNELNLKLNTPIIAIGNPNGVFGSVLLGNVVRKEMRGSIVDGSVGLYSSDIKYNKEGNGFVTDIKGRIVGIITTSYTETTGEVNCAFMGINVFLSGINRLVEEREMPYLGIKGHDVREGVAETLGISGGVYISNIVSGSPAYKGEIRVADVIVKMDKVEIHNLQEMRNYLSSCSSGDKVTIWVKRSSGDEYVDCKMTVALK